MHSVTESSQGRDITLTADDFELMDAALHVIPELRAAVAAAKLVRDNPDVNYPIASKHDLVVVIPNGRLSTGGHVMTPRGVELFVPDVHMPIDNEFDLLVKLYIAMLRCKLEGAAALNARPSESALHVEGENDE